MAVITIDGTRLEVPENKNVLECALEAGIYIPHLCHHPDLPENGSCRMCIVEVEGQEGITTSCTLRAQDGMVVHTTSERINKLRTLALELLLAGHPEDCSTCPKYGNCELQTLIQYIGANNARMRTRIKGIKMEEGNPLLIHDMNRCVLCGRCVRACNKLRGVGVLQYNKKDLATYVGTLHGKLLKDEDCRFCTACAEVCPTGSIRDKLQLLTTNLKKEEALVPCRTACPAHTDIPRYIRFVKEMRQLLSSVKKYRSRTHWDMSAAMHVSWSANEKKSARQWPSATSNVMRQSMTLAVTGKAKENSFRIPARKYVLSVEALQV